MDSVHSKMLMDLFTRATGIKIGSTVRARCSMHPEINTKDNGRTTYTMARESSSPSPDLGTSEPSNKASKKDTAFKISRTAINTKAHGRMM